MQIGLLDTIVAGKPRVDTFTRANYLGAVAARMDSFWVPDHLNALFPRALWKPEYCGLARLSPSVDAFLEPWTMLGNLDSEVMRAACLTAPDDMFAEHGLQHPLGVGFSGAQDLLPQEWDEQTALSYVKGVTPALMRDLGLVGTPDEVLEKAVAWRDAGVRHIVLINGCGLQRSALKGFTSTLPFIQIARRLKRL